MTASVSLFEMWEFSLHFVGRAALHQTHQVTDARLWWDGHEHVDMIARQHASDDLDAVLSTDLSADVTNPQLNVTLKRCICPQHRVFPHKRRRIILTPRVNTEPKIMRFRPSNGLNEHLVRRVKNCTISPIIWDIRCIICIVGYKTFAK